MTVLDVQKPLIVVLGGSNSGKDTLGTVALKNGYTDRFKWIAGLKGSIELIYGLPAGALEQSSYRNTLVPNKDYTFVELLVQLYEEQQVLDPLALSMYKDAAAYRLQELLKKGKSVVATDNRSPQNMQHIQEIAKQYPVAMVRIINPAAVIRSSDLHLLQNWTTPVPGASYWTIHNNADLATFERLCAILVGNIVTHHAGTG